MKQGAHDIICSATYWPLYNATNNQYAMFFGSNFTIPGTSEDVHIAITTHIEDFLIQYEENPQTTN